MGKSMDEKAIVKELMKAKGITQAQVAEKAGLKRQSNVSEMFRSQSMRVDNLVMILNVLDCELVIRSKAGVPDGNGTNGKHRPEYVVEVMER